MGSVVLDELELTLRTRDRAVPGRVLLRLVALYDSLSAAQKSDQAIDFDGFFVRLLKACDRTTRLLLAQHWSAQTDPPRQALRQLAFDRDPAIAALVITSANSLTELDLSDIARQGGPTQRQALADRLADRLPPCADRADKHRNSGTPPRNSETNSPVRATQGAEQAASPVEQSHVPTGVDCSEQTPLSAACPRYTALHLATRLALHLLDRPAPEPALLAALLTQDLAQDHQARLLARLALATNLPTEAVTRSFTTSEARYFATLLWALDLPEILVDRLMAFKAESFPLTYPDALKTLSDHRLTQAQARQALQFFAGADRSAIKPGLAVWP